MSILQSGLNQTPTQRVDFKQQLIDTIPLALATFSDIKGGGGNAVNLINNIQKRRQQQFENQLLLKQLSQEMLFKQLASQREERKTKASIESTKALTAQRKESTKSIAAEAKREEVLFPLRVDEQKLNIEKIKSGIGLNEQRLKTAQEQALTAQTDRERAKAQQELTEARTAALVQNIESTKRKKEIIKEYRASGIPELVERADIYELTGNLPTNKPLTLDQVIESLVKVEPSALPFYLNKGNLTEEELKNFSNMFTLYTQAPGLIGSTAQVQRLIRDLGVELDTLNTRGEVDPEALRKQITGEGLFTLSQPGPAKKFLESATTFLATDFEYALSDPKIFQAFLSVAVEPISRITGRSMDDIIDMIHKKAQVISGSVKEGTTFNTILRKDEEKQKLELEERIRNPLGEIPVGFQRPFKLQPETGPPPPP